MSCKQKAPLFLLIGLLGLGFFSCSGRKSNEVPVAQVGKEVLFRAEVEREVPPNLSKSITLDEKKNFTRRWVNTELLYLEAKRQGLDKLPEIQRELKRVERSLLANKLLEREFPRRPAVPDSQVEAYYKKNAASFVRNEDDVRLVYLIFSSKKSAKKALSALKKGKTAQQIAADSTFGSVELHDTGLVPRSQVPREFAAKIKKLKKGRLVGPLESNGEYLIIQLADVKAAGTRRTLAEVRPKILALLQQERERDLYHQLLNSLKSKQKVIMNLKALESDSTGSGSVERKGKSFEN